MVGLESSSAVSHQILASEAQLIAALERHDKGQLTMYNPLVYAVDPHCSYVCKYGNEEKPILFVGMSAAPFGMAQTGVPLGSLKHVKDYLNLGNFDITPPKDAHPKVPITGWNTMRDDPEGNKFWKFFESRYSVKEFAKKCYVATYCPMLYVDSNGKEIPPPCLPHHLRNQVISVCDMHIIDIVDILKPSIIVAIGGFTFQQVGKLFCSREVGPMVFPLLHPAPANPITAKRWSATVNDQLVYAGVPQLIAGADYVPFGKDEKKKKRCHQD